MDQNEVTKHFSVGKPPQKSENIEDRSATRIFLKGGLKNEKFCDFILMTYFRRRNLYDVKNDVISDFLKVYCVIVNFKDHELVKSRNFKSLKHKNTKTIRYFIFFLNIDLAKGGASAPLAPFLFASLIEDLNCKSNF